mmetsp:Transcript_33833/g.58046  ORF Transcript_33833/g.58046 Transcript_33833/m.58046 type:complete len:278 (+) Transcript_33833:84-917(+)|eukprot:CAMPEP_0205932524 /NCGR_PEP_ID=MMETSP1325-20131115/30054_1 /ASSEMBLY_ACC=CAM_ASM_000708 /TAXON_ID=236786 /ORGANISM="Florenciella sp., Strain RCC1007" /LENGTH=277 /DNA_ID=CAMNT_0053302241 /DNA_START=9 /DNA_END=842 /DNA_ORIENTATION=-
MSSPVKKNRSLKVEGGKKAAPEILSPASRDFMGGQAPAALDSPAKTPKSPHAKEGLPKIAEDKKPDGATFLLVVAPMMVAVPASIGLGMAFAMFTFGTTAYYESRIELVVQWDMHYAYLAAALVGMAVRLINMYPMRYKSAIMKGDSENLRSNMYVYKAIGPDAAEHHVVFDDDGDVGKYNRANRSLHHMVENHAIILASLVLGSFVFPAQTLACTAIWGGGRLLHQTLYAAGGYGKHAFGFLLAFMSSICLEGLLLLVAVKGFGVPIPSLAGGSEL